MPPSRSCADVYQMKVTLRGTKPPIWRRIQVAADTDLAELHDILQIVMGWEEAHLHQFIIGGEYYGVPSPTPFASVFDAEMAEERGVKLAQVVSGEKSTFVYEYDFGDSWEHRIVLEKILPSEEGKRCPVCVAGKGACPPEDCGGVWGYYDLLDVVQDPEHPDHDEMLEWLGGDLDPDAFDLEQVNRQLQKAFGKPRRRRRR